MKGINIRQIKTRLQDLPFFEKKEVYDFIEFLSLKYNSGNTKKFDKSKLLEVSVWDKHDIKVFKKISKDFNKWNIEKYY